MNLDGCVALVTGSSSGIGAATAKALAKNGCAVAVTWSKDQKGASETAAVCEALGGKTLNLQLDVKDDAQCRAVVETVVRTWGRLDIVVNSAGITRFCEHANLDGLSGQDFMDLYAVNVVGAYQVTRAAAAHLKKRPVAHVVNVASMAAFNGRGSSIAYAASKGALITMTKSLARVLGPVVRVNAVCPGLVKGKWTRDALDEENYESHMRLATNRSTLKALPTSDDVAAGIVACMTGSDLVTGDSVLLDAGAHLGTAALFQPPRS